MIGNTTLGIALFLLGASLASFYSNLAFRILFYFYKPIRKRLTPRQKLISLFQGRSHCDQCKKPLNFVELIPIMGFLFSKGKCKECNYKIPLQYFLAELLFGTIAIIFYFSTYNFYFTICFLFLLGHLLISVETDSKYFSLDFENLPFILIFGLMSNYFLRGRFPEMIDLYVFLGFFGFYLILFLLSRGGVGFGDVMFSPIYAFLAGHPWWMFYLNTSYILAVVVTIMTKKKGSSLKNKKIPMGVFFSIGLFLSYCAEIFFLGGFLL